MGLIANTETTATKNDLVIALVQRELISKAVVMPTIRDVSAYASKGSKKLEVPRGSSFSVEDRASGAAATQATVTYAVDGLLLDQMSTVSWVVDPQDELESAVDVEADTAARAGRAHSKNFDTKVIAGLEADSTATTTAGDISKSIFIEMRQSLLAAEADPGQLTFLCGPDQEGKLLLIDEFVRADAYGSSAIPSGVLGHLYGVPVVMSTQIAVQRFYMYDKDGYGFAIQQQLNIGQRAAPEYGSKAVLKAMDMKWGYAKLENGSLLRKDNN